MTRGWAMGVPRADRRWQEIRRGGRFAVGVASASIFARLQTPTGGGVVVRDGRVTPRRAGGVLRVQPDGHRITVRSVDHRPRASVTAATLRGIVEGSLRPVFYFFTNGSWSPSSTHRGGGTPRTMPIHGGRVSHVSQLSQ